MQPPQQQQQQQHAQQQHNEQQQHYQPPMQVIISYKQLSFFTISNILFKFFMRITWFHQSTLN